MATRTANPAGTRRPRWVTTGPVLHGAMAVSGMVLNPLPARPRLGNLKVFSGQAAFDGYAAFLRRS